MTPQSRGKSAKTAVFRHRWQAWQVVRSIAAVRQRPKTPRNWRCSFTFFESFFWHFNEKQRGEVIFRHSRPVSCKNQENGAGKQWSVHAPLKLPRVNQGNQSCVKRLNFEQAFRKILLEWILRRVTRYLQGGGAQCAPFGFWSSKKPPWYKVKGFLHTDLLLCFPALVLAGTSSGFHNSKNCFQVELWQRL